MPEEPAVIAPRLMTLPAKDETVSELNWPTNPMPMPLRPAEIVPVFLISPTNVEILRRVIPADLEPTVILPLLLTPPTNNEIPNTFMADEAAVISPLLVMPPANAEIL